MKRFLVITALAIATSLPVFAQTSTAPADHKDGAMDDMHHGKAPVPQSKSVNVTFQGRVTTLTVADLLELPQVTVHVHNAHRNADETYTGPLLSDVLVRAGLTASKETEPLILHSSVVATGTDKYFVVYSAAEVEGMFSKAQVIVAVMKGDLPNGEGGTIQLINTGDAKPARWVHGLAGINVMSLSPQG